jgi:twitching motility protein PilT
MKAHAIEGDFKGWVSNALRQSALFASYDVAMLERVVQLATLFEVPPGEVFIREGDTADYFYLLLMGEAIVQTVDAESGALIELGRVRPVEPLGEMAFLGGTLRTATAVALRSAYLLGFDEPAFDSMMDRLPGFARRLGKVSAARLQAMSRRVGLPEVARSELQVPEKEVVALLPEELIREFRLIPLRREADAVVVGFVDRPHRQLIDVVRRSLARANLTPVRIASHDFEDLARPFGLAGALASPSNGTSAAWERSSPAERLSDEQGTESRQSAATPKTRRRARVQTSVVASVEQLSLMEPILRRMLEVNASDLHLSAGQCPRWRIDGDLLEIPEQLIPRPNEIYEMLQPFMSTRSLEEFDVHHDCDFAFAVSGVGRFRVNMFRDNNGVGAAFRLIPATIPTMDQVGIPKGAQRLTELNAGLVLVCGPTGSGKSTTLATMIHHINQTRKSHIITIEDPVEFHHESRVAMVTQREVGKNTSGFQRALRSALREDPDIVLVGELRDLETMSLALETAQTGHLVFGTLHTSTAIGTIDRIIDMFPVEQHNQVRSTLADVLKGIINQNLCRRIAGGRVAAFETLLASSAVANCIRSSKTTNIATIMTTNKANGNKTMNEDLEALVRARTIDVQEALSRSPDRPELRQRMGMAT